jgi:phosphomannomutase
VVNSFSCTSRIDDMCRQLGLEQTITKIGFKYICGHMINEDVLVGGEESGGIAVKTHVPERDGLWIGLTIMEFMASQNKTLAQLIDEVYEQVGPFAMERYDLHITEELKQKVMRQCQNGGFTHFGDYTVGEVESVDGFKYHLGQGRWVMIRPSGTEPVLRLYGQADSHHKVLELLEQAKAEILG